MKKEELGEEFENLKTMIKKEQKKVGNQQQNEHRKQSCSFMSNLEFTRTEILRRMFETIFLSSESYIELHTRNKQEVMDGGKKVQQTNTKS